MNKWSIRRKRLALFIVLAILIVLVGVPLYFFLRVVPNCHDGKQNGDETGVDCGGSCTTLCTSESLPVISLGDPQILRVSSSTYEVAMLVRNPNPAGEIYRAGYSFTLYSASSSVPLKTVTGSTFVPANQTFALFEGPFSLPGEPAHAAFSWDSATLNWAKSVRPATSLDIENTGVQNATSSPRLEATVKNSGLSDLSDIQLTALVSDDTGTVFAASRTYLDALAAGDEAPAVFTWPAGFEKAPASVQIIPIVLPDASFVR